MSLKDMAFKSKLYKEIAQSYALFLERFVRVKINGDVVEPIPIPIGSSDKVNPAVEMIKENTTTVIIIASLAGRDEKNQWRSEQAGWYIACNGRMVVSADKTELTGWGGGALPVFHSKYRGFVGLVLFQSNNALELPWRTTKRGINQESIVYINVRNKMRELARQILTFLDKMYPSEIQEESQYRNITESIRPADIKRISKDAKKDFSYPKENLKIKGNVSIQYSVEKHKLELIRKHLRSPTMSGGVIGKLTFEKYLEAEGLK